MGERVAMAEGTRNIWSCKM